MVGDIAFVVDMGLAADSEGVVPTLMGNMIDNRIYLRDGMTGKILQEQHHLASLPGQLADFGMGLLLDHKPGAK